MANDRIASETNRGPRQWYFERCAPSVKTPTSGDGRAQGPAAKIRTSVARCLRRTRIRACPAGRSTPRGRTRRWPSGLFRRRNPAGREPTFGMTDLTGAWPGVAFMDTPPPKADFEPVAWITGMLVPETASEFPQTTPAKPKTLPSRMANETESCNQASRRAQIATFAIESPATPERSAGSARTIQGHDPARPRPTKIHAARGSVGMRRGSRTVEFAAKPQPSDIKPKARARVPLLFRAPPALFFSKTAPYIEGAGSPAMEINGRRNKPFGPGGSTRRLHPSPPPHGAGFGGGEPGSTRA